MLYPTLFSVFLIFCLMAFGSAERVILFSVPHISNQRTHTNVGRALKGLGHEPYVCIPHFMLEKKLVNTEGINVIAYGRYLDDIEDNISGKSMDAVWSGRSQSMADFRDIGRYIADIVRQILSDQELLARLKSLNADFLLLGQLPPFAGLVVLPYKLGLKFALMSPITDLYGQRVPFAWSFTPCQLASVFKPQDASLLDRTKTAICHFLLTIFTTQLRDDSLVREFVPERPFVSISELARKAEIYLVESDVVLDYPKPSLPHMKLIGGTSVSIAKPLSEPFKSFVEGSKNGVAVVTFGSMVVDIPAHITDKMVAAFQSQGLDVVWRVNLVSPNPKKILTSSWVPQNDILAHPKTQLFVSHCGANGQYEAVYHGVPMLCVPLILDQQYNAQRIVDKGLGLQVSIHATAREFADLMKAVSGNETYRSQIKQGSAVFRKLYKTPDKVAAFWIDHVMQYGGAYMRTADLDLPLYQFLALDVLFLCLVVCLITCLLLYGLCRCCTAVVRKRRPTAKSPKGKKIN